MLIPDADAGFATNFNKIMELLPQDDDNLLTIRQVF